jgi:uncharacterized protein (DUF1778 family)
MKKETRTETIILRVSPKEKTELQKKADKQERTLSDYVRRVALVAKA